MVRAGSSTIRARTCACRITSRPARWPAAWPISTTPVWPSSRCFRPGATASGGKNHRTFVPNACVFVFYVSTLRRNQRDNRPVTLSRFLAFAAAAGLLAASCGSAVVATPLGRALVPGPHDKGVIPSLEIEDVRGDDTAPRRVDVIEPSLSYDVAPRRLEPLAPPPAAKVLLGPLPFISQTANNCGPASVAEVLGFWGINRAQAEVQSVLRGDGNPYGMTPGGVPGYAASLGMDVVMGTSGTQDLLKELLRAGFPVIVNQTVSLSDLTFHYRPIEGFDDELGVFIASDPLIGPEHPISYAEFDRDWAYTGNRFMVIHPPDKGDALNAALAAGKWDPAHAEGGGAAIPWSVPGGGPAPVTAPVLSGKALPSGAYVGPVKVGFRATDQSGFGIASTTYSVDKQPARLYRGDFTIAEPGQHVLTFYSVNFSGSREASKTAEISIVDPNAPAPAASEAPRPPAQPSARAAPTAAAPASPSPAPNGPPARDMPAGGYAICPLYDQFKASKAGSSVAINIRLCDASGKNLSSPSVQLKIQSLLGPPTGIKPPAPSPFRYDAGLDGYQAIQPGGTAQGTYALYFTAGSDPAVHMVQFRIG